MNITVLAAGTWGTALAKVLAADNNVTVWSKFESEISELSSTKRHKNLPGLIIPDSIVFTTDIVLAMENADVIILATPSVFVRETCVLIKEHLKAGQIITCVAKGIEQDTLFTMSEIISDVLGDANPIVALSGPTHAEEVVKEFPTLIVSASADSDAAKTIQNLFAGTCIRTYTNHDIKGIELCGATKNIIALACGISTGLGFGDNTRAALMTRGISEIRNLGVAMGCTDDTFLGLAGIGDLIVTATSFHSRNFKAGMYIGEGMSVSDAVKKVGMVVEGIYAIPAAVQLSEKYGVELPIIKSVDMVVNHGISAKEAVDRLLNRRMSAEFKKRDLKLRYEEELLFKKDK